MKSKIYKVKFNCPPREDGRTEYFFNTLTAIYKIFTKKFLYFAEKYGMLLLCLYDL